jgi:hypothetical protein
MHTILSRFCVLLGLLLIGASLSIPAVAQSRGGGHSGGAYSGGHGGGYGGHRGGYGGGWHGGTAWWGLGLGLGLGLEAAYLGNPYYYYPAPTYYYPYAPSTVIVESPPLQMPPQEMAVAPPTSQPTPSWYYCDPLKGYYPYVTQCPEPWRMVPAVPPEPAR